MTAQSAHEYDPDDPVEILRVLPSRFREQFLSYVEGWGVRSWIGPE